MRVHLDDKIIVRIDSDVLKYGDLAWVKQIDHGKPFPYYCFCPLKREGEWLPQQFFDKYKEKKVYHRDRPAFTHKPSPEIKNVPRETKKPLVRPPTKYTNIPSNYRYDNNNDTPLPD